MLNVLVVDDEYQNRSALAEILNRMGHQCDLAENGRVALDLCHRTKYDLILSDIRMPELDGLELFKALKRMGTTLKMPHFVFMTAYGRIEDAVFALREGALHFLTKPLRRKDVQLVVNDTEQLIGSSTLKAASKNKLVSGEITYQSKAMAELLEQAHRIAATSASVFIFGESGVGKELIAREIHRYSSRSHGPFVAVNVAAIPESVMESELFGHEKGSFTGADKSYHGQIRSADQGTFFIDEVTSMSLSAQAKWLRVLQEKQVWPVGSTKPVPCDVRWISASNQDPRILAHQGRFREDLLYRLQVVTLHVPPLRDRPEDIEVLLQRFIQEICEQNSKSVRVSEQVLNVFKQYAWPGNVRELRNVVERLVTLATTEVADIDLLPSHMTSDQKRSEIRLALGTSLAQAQDKLIEETLRMCHGDKVMAAKILGINQRTIYRWLDTKSTQ